MTRRMDRNDTDKYQVSFFVIILKHKFHKFMPLLTLNLSCENLKYPARKHFEKTNTVVKPSHYRSLFEPMLKI